MGWTRFGSGGLGFGGGARSALAGSSCGGCGGGAGGGGGEALAALRIRNRAVIKTTLQSTSYEYTGSS